jgi:hypothetical protein
LSLLGFALLLSQTHTIDLLVHAAAFARVNFIPTSTILGHWEDAYLPKRQPPMLLIISSFFCPAAAHDIHSTRFHFFVGILKRVVQQR